MVKRKPLDSIEFPANPFVALADLLIVLLLIVLLALLHQSVSSSRLIERMAVADLQNQLFAAHQGKADSAQTDPTLRKAFENGDCKLAWVDGDLQRFRISGALLFDPYSHELRSPYGSRRAVAVLAAFGQVLAKQQGNLKDPGSGLFKRIIVQGNTDASEGTDAQQWALSMARAQAVVDVLQTEAGLSPLLIEASGRGHWDPAEFSASAKTQRQRREVAARNRRIDIIIVYSGHRAMQYLSDNMGAPPAAGPQNLP